MMDPERPPDPDVSLPEPMDTSDEPPPTLPPSIHLTEHKVVPVVESLFLVPEDSANRHLTRDVFLTLQKTLSSELNKCKQQKDLPKILKALVLFLLKRTSTENSDGFKKAILDRPHIACPLFRLLTTVTDEKLVPTLRTIAAALQNYADKIDAADLPKAKPLLAILKRFTEANESVKFASRPSPEVQKNPLEVFKTSRLDELESCGSGLVGGESTETGLALCRLLPQAEPARQGVLIDWLVQLEPEIIGVATATQASQLELLFSRGKFTCRPFLLTLLTHRASWATLHHCTTKLLDPKVVNKYDPSAVLDFLMALTCNPKLLQGREKHTPKHAAEEDILGLPLPRLLCMTDYIVEEAVLIEDVKEALDRMNLRLSLLSPHTDHETMAAVIGHLEAKASKPSGKNSEMCRQLLVQLYLRVPSILTHLSETELTKYLVSSPALVSGSSAVDPVSHSLITALTATPPNKDWNRRAQELDLATRKMAATHPLLFLRQISMLSAALRGRVHLESPVFRSRHHLALFTQVLGAFELVGPHLFRPEYSPAVHDAFDIYFAMFKQHGHLKDVSALLTRFVALIKAYIAINGEDAMRYLQTQAHLISELQSQHPSLGSVCIMMSGVGGGGGVEGGAEVLVTVPTPPDALPPNWPEILQGLNTSSKVLASLQQLDTATTRHPALLSQASVRLSRLLASDCAVERSAAHHLLLRHLRHTPSDGPSLLPAYRAALLGPSVDVVTAALDRLPEVIVCSQEVAMPLLETVFALGLTQSLNSLQCITKSLALLNLQSGC